MKHLHIAALLLSSLLLATPAYTADTTPSILTGGIGDEELATLKAAESDYTAKLVFTGEGGMYLSDVDVVVRDSAQRELAHVVTQGPIMLIQLPAGTYQVKASTEGHTLTQPLTVDGKALVTKHVRFPVTQ